MTVWKVSLSQLSRKQRRMRKRKVMLKSSTWQAIKTRSRLRNPLQSITRRQSRQPSGPPWRWAIIYRIPDLYIKETSLNSLRKILLTMEPITTHRVNNNLWNHLTLRVLSARSITTVLRPWIRRKMLFWERSITVWTILGGQRASFSSIRRPWKRVRATFFLLLLESIFLLPTKSRFSTLPEIPSVKLKWTSASYPIQALSLMIPIRRSCKPIRNNILAHPFRFPLLITRKEAWKSKIRRRASRKWTWSKWRIRRNLSPSKGRANRNPIASWSKIYKSTQKRSLFQSLNRGWTTST